MAGLIETLRSRLADSDGPARIAMVNYLKEDEFRQKATEYCRTMDRLLSLASDCDGSDCPMFEKTILATPCFEFYLVLERIHPGIADRSYVVRKGYGKALIGWAQISPMGSG
jgi:hypothetical protein